MTSGWGRIPIFELEDYLVESEYRIVRVYLDLETEEFVIEYEVVNG